MNELSFIRKNCTQSTTLFFPFCYRMLTHDISQQHDNVTRALSFYHVSKIDIPPFTPCVYLICSSKQADAWYIGQCKDFCQRLAQHNSLKRESPTTKSADLKPWIPAAVITGFIGDAQLPENEKKQREIEQEWQFTLNIQASCNVAQAIDIGIRALHAAQLRNQHDTRFQHLKLKSFFRSSQ